MPRPGPIKRKDLIHYLRQLDFEGPFSGGKHQFMVRENITLRIPDPHQGDIGEALLLRILKQANIERDEWEKL
ncbi:MAG TPA: type II toxin-antitoxin system HicA family toxin [Ktedonobacteraceae bacterium]|jgi:predicted RNA binding protein YcfA (HicA-like mRNA interferase family)|nr:type II toxin-antitoxin system HicA family toxin [Ktedonobacteraceae bacterium]